MIALTAFQSTLGLIITFGGIGVVVTGVLIHTVAQAMGERAANRRRGPDE